MYCVYCLYYVCYCVVLRGLFCLNKSVYFILVVFKSYVEIIECVKD